MKPRHRAILSALVALLASAAPDVAVAAERGCPAVVIEPDAGFLGRFPNLIERIRLEFTARADVDACARVDLCLQPHGAIDVSVTLPDGRAASRSVARSEDVVPTLQALLLVPDTAPVTPDAPAARSPTPAPKRAAPEDRRGREERETLASPAAATTREIGIELSVLTGARLGDGQLGLGAGALSFLEVKGWLIGFEGRIDNYRAIRTGGSQAVLELAVLAGKRLDFGNLALDLTAGPAIAMNGIAWGETRVARYDGPAPAVTRVPESAPPPSNGSVPRCLVGARLGFSPRSVFRTFLGLDGEFGPASDRADPDAAHLPRFSVGLALGATVGTP